MALSRVHDLPVIAVVKVITVLVGMISFASVSPHLDAPYSLSFAALFAVSLFFEATQRFLFPRWALNLISLIVIAVLILRVDLIDPVTPIIEALTILLGIKLLERKEFRDYMQIFAIAVLLFAASSLLSLSISFIPFFLAFIFLLTLAVVFLAYHSQDPHLVLDRKVAARIVQKVLLIPLFAIPLTALLFVILPRTKYPLLNFLNAADRSKTGFSERVALGEIADIQEDTTVIMRVKTERLPDDLLYWRGIVLDRFDGRQWLASQRGEQSLQRPPARGRRIAQTVYLEPYDNRYLFGLDFPVSYTVPRRVSYRGEGVFTLEAPVDRRIQYEVVSVPSDRIDDHTADLSAYREVPARSSPRIEGLAREITRGVAPAERPGAVLDHLRGGAYAYSLSGLPTGGQPLEDFLFTYRYGNCEYFASAMALMLRHAGVASRVVGGYRGGFYNDLGQYYIVPQKNAHVWVEAYLEGAGWVRFDPTPVSSDFFTSLPRDGLLMKIRFMFDSMNYYWNASVIGYDLRKQISLYTRLSAQLRDSRMAFEWAKDRLLPVALGLLGLTCAGALLYRTVRARRGPEVRVIASFERKMAKYGYHRKRSEGLEEFVRRVRDDDLRQKAGAFVEAFQKRYYRDERFSGSDVSAFKKMIRGMG